MKADAQENQSFSLALKITFDSAEEAAKFYAIFNNPTITTGADFNSEADMIRDAIGMQHNNYRIHTRLADHLRSRKA